MAKNKKFNPFTQIQHYDNDKLERIIAQLIVNNPLTLVRGKDGNFLYYSDIEYCKQKRIAKQYYDML